MSVPNHFCFFVQLFSTDLWLFPKIYLCDRRQPDQHLTGI
jgi:hypothetical protein